jgi:hypothetical protein
MRKLNPICGQRNCSAEQLDTITARTILHNIRSLPEDDTAASDTLASIDLELSALPPPSALLSQVGVGLITSLSLSDVVVDASLGRLTNVSELWASLGVGEDCEVAKACALDGCAVGL